MKILMDYAKHFCGVPYKWSGNNPLEGFDCSGLVMELLKSAGERLPFKDMTAQQLYDFYMAGNGEVNRYSPGALAFFGESASKITHVGMLVCPYRMIEAGGGGRLVLTRQDALAASAMVRIRPIKSRKDLIGIVKPRYNAIGMI